MKRILIFTAILFLTIMILRVESNRRSDHSPAHNRENVLSEGREIQKKKKNERTSQKVRPKREIQSKGTLEDCGDPKEIIETCGKKKKEKTMEISSFGEQESSSPYRGYGRNFGEK